MMNKHIDFFKLMLKYFKKDFILASCGFWGCTIFLRFEERKINWILSFEIYVCSMLLMLIAILIAILIIRRKSVR